MFEEARARIQEPAREAEERNPPPSHRRASEDLPAFFTRLRSYSRIMERFDTAPPPSPPARTGGFGLLLAGALAAIGAAIVPCASLLAQHGPGWLALGAGLAVFPLLPLLWHGLAEVAAARGGRAPWTAAARFGLRSLAVALLVLAVSLADLGPEHALQNVKALAARFRDKPAVKQVALPPPAIPFGLEPYIPADATLAVGLSGSAATEQLLAAHGVETRAKLAALATCQVDLANARILIAARGRVAHLIAVRAPGIAEERNLYCLVGILGQERMQVVTDATSGTKILQVKGLLSRPLTFHAVDPTTLVAVDGPWQDSKRLFAEGGSSASGLLTTPLLRVDRGTPLWVASVAETMHGTWDLAVDSRQEDGAFKLRGSSTPPSGEKDRAWITLQVPAAFASSLPEIVITMGIRGVVSALAAAGASVPPAPAASPMPAH